MKDLVPSVGYMIDNVNNMDLDQISITINKKRIRRCKNVSREDEKVPQTEI